MLVHVVGHKKYCGEDQSYNYAGEDLISGALGEIHYIVPLANARSLASLHSARVDFTQENNLPLVCR